VRRTLLVLTVALVMVTMVASVLPAFAASEAECGIGAIESQGATGFFTPPENTLGGATSEFAHQQKASGSILGQYVAFEPPPANRCSPADPTSPLS
jgi:hypothetical protein